MAKALEAFVELSEDEGLKAYEEAKYIQDEIIANRTAYAVDEAVEKTREEERKKAAYKMAYAVDEAVEKAQEEERKKTALGFLNKGVSIQIIQEVTGLSEEAIRNLKKS